MAGCEALNQNPSTSVTADSAITSVKDLENAVNGAYYVATYGTRLTMTSELCIYGDLIGPDSYRHIQCILLSVQCLSQREQRHRQGRTVGEQYGSGSIYS